MAPSGHRRNLQPKSSALAEIFIRAVLAIVVYMFGRTKHCSVRYNVEYIGGMQGLQVFKYF